MLWIVIISALTIILLSLLIAKINLKLQLVYSKNEQYLYMELFLFKLKLYRRKTLFHSYSENKSIELDNYPVTLNEWKQLLQSSSKLLTFLLSNIQFKKLTWRTAGGAGDACITGTVTGLIWSLKGIIIGQLVEKSNLKCEPFINVEPHFQQTFFQTELTCMVSIRIGKAIHVFFKGLRLISKEKSENNYRKRRILEWKSILFKA
ncbi:DUF2953 domain-containing protein [Virgibacillus sp. SK37]|uniref:DUF2953 domain-containing protein n=1 Tax=Virgibacillus sp. SK37 TaxID=403957 RepID=UPI0004D1B1E2|nr:DUF2953 domain-containing protein [Virgibacillus sp. SK37]AIF45370.1 hypothetical protein X953_08515 [Virgibacillus sp. SK37]